ncbi:MAG: LysM peptidoglycan-binding domain-containing protein [Bacteroidota bacterium]
MPLILKKKSALLVFLMAGLLPGIFMQRGLGQTQRKALQIGLGMGGNVYVGDLSDASTFLHRVYPGGNISLQADGNRRIRGQVNAGFGTIAEQFDEEIPPTPDGLFPVQFIETSFFYLDGRLRFFPLPQSRFQPFVGAGAGFLIFSPKDEEGKFLSGAFLTRPEGEEYPTTIPQLPLSLGIRTNLNSLLGMELEYVFRVLPTDYLDNTGQLGTRSGNDQLHTLQFGLFVNLRGKPDPIIRQLPDWNNSQRLVWQQADSLVQWPKTLGSDADGEGSAKVIHALAPPPFEMPEIVVAIPRFIQPLPLADQVIPVEIEPVITLARIRFSPAPRLSWPIPPVSTAIPVEEAVLPKVKRVFRLSGVRPETAFMLTARKPAFSPPSISTYSTWELDQLQLWCYWETISEYAAQLGDVFYYRPASPATYAEVQRRFRVPPFMVQELNPGIGNRGRLAGKLLLPDLRKWAEKGPVPVGENFTYYQSKAGETLLELANRFGVNPDYLQRVNELPSKELLPGTYLIIVGPPKGTIR